MRFRVPIVLLFAFAIMGQSCGGGGGGSAGGGAGGGTGGGVGGGAGGGVGGGGPDGGPGPSTCGNGFLEAGEQCDDGNVLDLDGCSAACAIEPGYQCPVPNFPCDLCGDGVQNYFEQCDDGNLAPEDGCSPTCALEPGYVCVDGLCYAAACGDGVRAGAEQCDDGGKLSGDGCSILCRVEKNYACVGSGPGSCHLTVCGDGVVEGAETCDDGNAVGGDGCTACAIDLGYACPTPNAACVSEQCGNGVVAGAEQCDDGGAIGGDGCSAVCQLEPNFYCPTPGQACVPAVCGNGVVEGLEVCDDGNAVTGTCSNGVTPCASDAACGAGTCNYDGCTAACNIQPLFHCAGTPSVCDPFVDFVLVRKFTVSNVNPDGLYYDPNTRSFVGFKQSSSSQEPVELCLDGTFINPNANEYTPGGTATALPLCPSSGAGYHICQAGPRDGLACTTGADCARARGPASGLVDSTYDPFTNTVLVLLSDGTLYQVPLDFAVDPANDGSAWNGYSEVLTIGSPTAMVVGEDGRLYVLSDQGVDDWTVFDRDMMGATTFSTSPSGTTISVPETTGTGNSAVSSSFLIPGEGLIATHGVVNGSLQFVFYTTDGVLVGTSTLPGIFFSNSPAPYTYGSVVTGAETATDGSGFITCSFTGGAEPCQLFAQSCAGDADCADLPGTACLGSDGLPCLGGICHCTAPATARDDVAYADLNSSNDVIDVLANDTKSLATCRDNTVQVIKLCAVGEDCCSASVASTTTAGRGGVISIGNGGANVIYTPPADFCGSVDAFSYCALLGGGDQDSADVRVLVPCTCGNGALDSGEACDDGNALACDGCRPNCTIQKCGDGIVDCGEDCDDANAIDNDACPNSCRLTIIPL